MWLVVKIIIITAAYILFKLIQTTQIYNNIRKVWRNHIACLIKCRERRKILMPFKNACLQFLYALFWFIVLFYLFMRLSISFGFEQSGFASCCFMLVIIYLIGMFWHISSIVGNISGDNSNAKNSKKLEIKKANNIKTNQQKAANENDWIKKIIWHDKEEIEDDAKNYDKTPWYCSRRFIAPTLYFVIQTLVLIFITKERDIYTYIGAVWLAFSLIYFSVKGYRLAILLLTALIIFDFIYGIIIYNIQGGIIVARFMIYGGFVGELITAFRVERYMAKNKLCKKKKRLRDFLVGFLFPSIVAFSAMVICEIDKPLSKDDETSAQMIGTIYMHTTGVINYCQDAGYAMTTYPETFKRKFADKIVFAEQEMKRLDVNAPSIYEIEGMRDTSYNAWIDERQVLIARLVMNEHGISPNEFQWDEKYYQLLTQTEFCQLIDEMADKFIDSNQDLDILRN